MNKYAAIYFLGQTSRRSQNLWLEFKSQLLNEPFSKNDFMSFLKQHGVEVHSKALQRLQDDVERGIQCGLIYIDRESALYPSLLSQMDDPPLILCIRGSLGSFWQGRIAIVGSREPRPESNTLLESVLNPFLAATSAVVVSGGARGIDQKAHLGSLQRGLPTIAVIPSGLLNIYPPAFQDWQGEVLKGGGMLVSEYLPSQVMKKSHFEARNRIISGFSHLVFVVEARKKSGSLITARCAIAQGKTVAVVPGHPTDSHFLGCLDLLSDGAFPIRCAEDLIMLYRAESHFFSDTTH